MSTRPVSDQNEILGNLTDGYDVPEASALMNAAKAAAAQAMTGAADSETEEVAPVVEDILDAVSGPGSHTVTISGPAIPPGMLTFASLHGQETLSKLFCYSILVKAPDSLNLGYFAPSLNQPLKAMVGKEISVEIELDGHGKRYISGLVTAARNAGYQGRNALYELTVEPWLKLATQTSDYKIFQDATVVDILSKVLADYPYEVEKRLTEEYPKRSFQVQYGEKDFDFIQRLMEEFGIYYYFEHEAGKHKLVLVDAIGTHRPCPGAPTLPFFQKNLKLHKEFVQEITGVERLVSGKWSLGDFDFQRPKAQLASSVAMPRETGHADFERYEWPGDYFDKGEGDMLTRIRMEAQKSLGCRVFGSGNLRTVTTGNTFTLTKCPTVERNQEYLVVESSFMIQEIAASSGQGQSFSYHSSFELLPTSEKFRPQRSVAKPRTHGPQSAIVTGPAGEEIWTDKFGRIKVQFLWDRYGQKDENSSCWVRVSQPWAGKGFGGIQIPRIGQEVLIDFKNGDPDMPIVVGRVYNNDTMPPWGLPDNKTQSGLFSHTIGGGPDNANALRFEDKPGEEEVWLHAEKDQRIEVNHDESHWVGNDREKTIDHDETVTVHNDRKKTIDHNETDKIGDNWKIKVGKNKQETVGLTYVESTGIAKMMNVGMVYSENVGIAMNTLVGMVQASEIGLMKKLMVGQSYSADIGKTYELSVGDKKTESTGKVAIYEAGDHLELVCGKAKIVLTKDGNIYFKGQEVHTQAKAAINSDADLIQLNCEVAKGPPAAPGSEAAQAAGESGAPTPGGGSSFVASNGGGGLPGGGLPGGSPSLGGLGGLASGAGGLLGAAATAAKAASALGIGGSKMGIVANVLGAVGGGSGGGAGGTRGVGGGGTPPYVGTPPFVG